MTAEDFERQFPLLQPAVAVQVGEAVLQLFRIGRGLRFGELFEPVADLVGSIDRDRPDDDDHRGDTDEGDPGAFARRRGDLDRGEPAIERPQREAQEAGGDRAAEQLPGQGLAFADPGRIGEVVGRENVRAEREQDRHHGRRQHRQAGRDQVTARRDQDEGDGADDQDTDRSARERVVEGDGEDRDRRRGEALGDRLFLAAGGEAGAEEDRDRDEEAKRVPVGQRVTEPVVFDRRRDRMDARQDPRDEAHDRDHHHRRREDPQRPDESLPGPAEGAEEDERQPVHEGAVELDQRLRRRVRPERRDQGPDGEATEPDRGADQRRAEPFERVLGED